MDCVEVRQGYGIRYQVACPNCRMAATIEVDVDSHLEFFYVRCQFCGASFRVDEERNYAEVRRQKAMLRSAEIVIYTLAGIFALAVTAALTLILVEKFFLS